MLEFIDTHAHLHDPAFSPDLPDVLARATAAGVRTVILMGEDLAHAQKNIALAENYPMLRAGAGLYPDCLDMEAAEILIAFIRDHRNEIVAIGEVGLDYWIIKTDSEREVQREIFKRFIELSLELNLPINVHSRSAGRQAVSLLLAGGAKKVQLHAFDGRAAAAMEAVEAGYYFSVPPSVIRSRQKQKLVGHLPLSCLLLETDSPVLVPVCGQRNEPAHIRTAAEEVARIKNLPLQAVVEQIWQNTLQLYGDCVLPHN
jgi:TatD DNase family protein